MKEAIFYIIKSRTVSNKESARLSTPNLFIEKDGRFFWRTNLIQTEKYWNEWFKGLNHNFLNTNLPKILLLAEPDRMDKEFTIA